MKKRQIIYMYGNCIIVYVFYKDNFAFIKMSLEKIVNLMTCITNYIFYKSNNPIKEKWVYLNNIFTTLTYMPNTFDALIFYMFVISYCFLSCACNKCIMFYNIKL